MRKRHEMKTSSVYALSALFMLLGAGCMSLLIIITS